MGGANCPFEACIASLSQPPYSDISEYAESRTIGRWGNHCSMSQATSSASMPSNLCSSRTVATNDSFNNFSRVATGRDIDAIAVRFQSRFARHQNSWKRIDAQHSGKFIASCSSGLLLVLQRTRCANARAVDILRHFRLEAVFIFPGRLLPANWAGQAMP